MNKCFILLFLLIFIYEKNASGQNDPNIQLTKVVPASPEAASLGKFGDVPVGYFTGQVNTAIPLLEYGNSILKGSVSLSYSPGGIKVEEISSWIGAGWALNAGGVITRTIRGIADEKTNGYFTTDMKAKFMMEHYQDPTYHLDIVYRHEQAAIGMYDLEPDIFIFNFDGNIGKFYYNQETGQFYTMTRSALKVSYNDNEFKILAPNGNKYYFTERETTTTNSTTCYTSSGAFPSGSYSENTSSWLLTKIENSNNTDQIIFEYNNTGSYTFNTIQTTTKYLPLAMSSMEGSPLMSDQNCITNITINAKKISAISWKNGYILFKSVNNRYDLAGEKRLDTIELHSLNGQSIKNFAFKYSYFGGRDSLSSRLRLDSIHEFIDSSNKNPHYAFEYETGVFPSTLSYAQDYWGYYNGQTSNTNLIPRFLTFNTGNGQPMIWPGASRVPVFNYAKIGTLKKLYYPTGGYTEFIYESNKVNNSLLPPEYAYHFEHLEGDHNGGQQTYYETEFTIDVPPNYYNGFHSGGGVYARFSFEEIGCTYVNYEPNSCAVLAVTGLSSGATGATITNPNVLLYFPNGTYRLSASFNQGNTPGFEDFYFEMRWEVPDLTNLLAGGLRIQKIIDYDGINHANDKIRRFEYLKEDSTCSGYFISDWDGIFHDEFRTIYTQLYPGNIINIYHRLYSPSNYPQVSDHGNYAVYLRVTEFNGENGENGKTIYNYNSLNDFISQFPYYTVSNEWARGQLLAETKYENKNQVFDTVQMKINTFSISNPNDSNTNNIAIGIKQGVNKLYLGGNGALTQQEYEQWQVPAFNYYETVTGWTKQTSSKTVNNITSSIPGIESTASLGYNDINFSQNLSKITDSKGDSLISRITYPVDYNGILPTWLQYLKDNNILSAPIEKVIIKKLPNNQEYLISAVLTIYKDGQPLPYKIYTINLTEPLLLSNFTPAFISSGNLIKDSRYIERISINLYDDFYNILEQQKPNDVKEVFLWGYNSQYPVAKIINTTYDIANTYITQSILDAPTSEADLRNHLNNLRTIQGAFVTTYTYKPLVGITSETSPNGKTIYYEYDSFNRLKLIRDQDNNIIKKICYNYAGQPENCAINCTDTTANWQNTTTALRCQQGNCGNTGYQEQEQNDMNPCSSTFNQTRWVTAGYNPTACPLPTCVSLTSTNVVSYAGYTASYDDGAGHIFTFYVPTATGLQPLGTVPAGNYTLTISRTSGSPIYGTFKSGCFKQTITGSSAVFYNVAVSASSCNSITVDLSAN